MQKREREAEERQKEKYYSLLFDYSVTPEGDKHSGSHYKPKHRAPVFRRVR